VSHPKLWVGSPTFESPFAGMNEGPNGSSEISTLVADRPDHWQLRLDVTAPWPPKAETRLRGNAARPESERLSGDGGASAVLREFEHSAG
jgi:hypothetical protein